MFCPNTHHAACGIETSFRQNPLPRPSPNTHHAACGIETPAPRRPTGNRGVPTHIMLRAALKHNNSEIHIRTREVPTHIMLRAALKLESASFSISYHICPNTHHAACGIETTSIIRFWIDRGPNTHHAACGIETALTQSHKCG